MSGFLFKFIGYSCLIFLLSGKLSAQSVGLNLSTGYKNIIDSYKLIYNDNPIQFFYGAGVSFIKPVRKRFFIKTGTTLLSTQIFLENADDIRIIGSNIEKVGLVNIEERQHFLMVPLLANYYLLNSPNTNLYVSAGTKLLWLYRTRIWYNATYDGERMEIIKGKDNRNHFVSAFSIGFGLKQPITSKLMLLITPSVDFYSYSNKGADLENKNFELNVDLLYQF